MIPAPDEIAVLDDDPFSEAVLSDPRTYQKKLREAGPIVWLSKYGFYAVGGYEEVSSVLSDWKQYSSARGVGTTDFAKEEPWWGERAVLIESDPPRHNQIRAHVLKVLNPRSVAELGPGIRQEANLLLDRVLQTTRFDAQTEIANVFPLKVFGDALGIDSENRETLLTIGDLVFNNFGPRNSVLERARKAADVVGAVEWMRSRTARDAVREGSLGRQLHELSDTGDLTPAEAANVMRGQLAAGVDTTVAALGYTLYCFARFPDQYALVREDPGLAVKAFEEAVRLLSPIQCILRTTTGNAELAGQPVRPNTKIVISNAAANRDPRKFDNPDEFDVNRNFTGHVGFGRGVHTCVGMHVAKLEAENLLQAFVERVREVRLAGEPGFKLNNTVRGLSSLPLEVAFTSDRRHALAAGTRPRIHATGP